MDMKEELVELLTDNLPRIGNLPKCDNPLQYTMDEIVERIADHLIAHGVTVQEWIPGYDYPKETGFYNCYYKTPDSNLWRVGMCYWNDTNWIQVGFMPVAVQVMFYMPLPQPPKGE